MPRLSSRIIIEPVGSLNQTFDKLILFIVKSVYLIHRVLIRMIFGKTRREVILQEANKKLHYTQILSGRFSPSFYFISILYGSKLTRKLDGKHQKLFKVMVPKYSYRIYCPPFKNDFIGVTTREEDIIDNYFSPAEGDTVIDIGAHIGRYTLIASKRVGSSGLVIAVEPDPSNIEMLNKNIELNNLSNIQIIHCAVCAEQKKIRLYLPGKDSEISIYNTIMQDRAHSSQRSIEVKGYTLDFIADKYSDIIDKNIEKEIWIKIDVEGAEYEVLKGATNLLRKNQDISILMEIHNLREGFNLFEPILKLLKEYDFVLEFEKVYEGGEKHIVLKKHLV
jgi:FkbM family methyltransferase